MEKNERKTNYSIKSKLVSAVAMLLVATIMVVSSTYAWFTLSTAPEITGISTAVGANGALEMLLATKDAQENWVYGTGSLNNTQDMTVRNTYWGNLVDLSDLSYGSHAITLYPSVLNINNNAVALSPLRVPVYGADGRVETEMPSGAYAKYDGTNFLENDSYYGFRGIGVASGLSERQQAFRAALSELSTAQSESQKLARESLSNNGTTLANIAILKAFSTVEKPYTTEHVNAIKSMITGLENALAEAEDAYIEAIVVFVLSNMIKDAQGNPLQDSLALSLAKNIRTNVESVQSAELGSRITAALDTIGAVATGFDSATAKTAAENALLGYKGVFVPNNEGYCAINKVAEAKEKAGELTASEFNWTEISSALLPIVDMNKIQVNDIPANEVSSKKAELIEKAYANGVTVKIASGGGVYADIADISGDYRVDIIVDLKPALGSELTLPAKMVTASNQAKSYFSQISDVLNAESNRPNDAAAGALPLTEMYGYVIDLAFRTNAAQSNLLLQTDAVDRIYNGNNNAQTMGSGSNMTFSILDPNFTEEKAKSLMGNFRVVFFDTNTGNIFATAKLDTTNTTIDAEGNIIAKLYIFKNATATKYFSDSNTPDDTADDKTYYKVGDTFYSSSLCSESTKLTTAPDVTGFTESSVEVEIRDNVITALNQNAIKHISALVYLDGATIENKDVAATAVKSLTGSLNLQFASSATLTPMEYGNLHTAK